MGIYILFLLLNTVTSSVGIEKSFLNSVIVICSEKFYGGGGDFVTMQLQAPGPGLLEI